MANIATLTVSLVAETARFTASLKKSKKDADKFGRAVKKSLTVVASIAVVAGGALIALARQNIQAADKIGKTAKALNLSAEALQEYRFAAQQSGVETRGLDDSFRRFNRRLGEFANSGAGPAAKALGLLNVNVRDTGGAVRPTQVVLDDVIDQLVRVENQSQRAALAAQLFGDDFGPKLVPLLDEGSAGIARLRQEARDLGIVISNESVAAAERAQDSFGRLEAVMRGRVIKVFADNAEAVEQATEAILDFVLTSIQGFNRLRKFFGFETETEKLKSELRELGDEAVRLEGILAGGGAVPSGASRNQGALGGITVQGIKDIAEGAPAAERRLAEVNSRLVEINGLLVEIEKNRNALANLGRTKTGSPLAIAPEQERPGDLTRDITEQINERFATEFGEQDKQFAEAFETRLRARLTAVTAPVSEFSIQAARSVQQAWTEFFFDPFDDGLKGLLSSFIDTIRRMVANLLSSQLLNLLSKVGGPIGSIFGSLASGSAGGRQLGGFLRAGKSFNVGEGGPERFTPGTSGTLRPIASGNFNFETNISGGSLTAAQLIPILEENNRVQRSQFLDLIDRGAFQ